jgi:2,4-dienoyl-CoA reductase-like NADH-dependent reductase (Old Yellow Enzyme family)/NADPH-dependent 2,4-dienoyl-CoA reductase/sulfur reductase-like enzyme
MGRKILEPIRIKNMEIKNRLGFPPFLGNPHGPKCEVNNDTIEWFVLRAKGGVGFALSGAINPLPDIFEEMMSMPPVMFPHPLTFHEDSYAPGYKRLTEGIHEHGMTIGAQIGAGGATKGSSPSPFSRLNFFEAILGADLPAEAYTLEELEEIKDLCVKTAVRCKTAGFDFVELHTAHGYVSLWGGFMSPFTNTRTDKYGGSWENRLRFPAETIQAMRRALGEDYPIFIRVSVDELHGPDGVTLEDTIKYTVPIMEEAGVDCFDVTMGTQLHNPNNIPSLYVPRGHYMRFPAAIKKAAKVPVIGVGRILEMEMAEKYLEAGYADLIYIGRQLIADPETPKKYFEGRSGDIRKCIGDLPLFGNCDRGCTVNPTPPAMGNTDDVVPAETPKKVLVVGGGVAGMEAARIAALRGHTVMLLEKEAKLGGTVETLSRNPLNSEFGNLVEYLTGQMARLNIDVRVCKRARSDDVKAMNPDVVIIATGATMSLSEEAKGKFGVMTHTEALAQPDRVGRKVVIQGLGYGSELAIALAEHGKEVTLFGKGTEIAPNVSILRRFFLLKRLTDVNVCRGDGDIPMTSPENPRVMTGRKLKEITASEVVVEDDQGTEEGLPYDTFVVSLGRRSNDELYKELKETAKEVHAIGDAGKIGEILDAMVAANEVARKI